MMNVTLQFFANASLFAFFISCGIGLYTYYKFPQTPLVRVFLALCILISAINFIEYKLKIVDAYEEAYLWANLQAIWPFIIAGSLHFILLFKNRAKNTTFVYVLLYGTAAFFSCIELTTNLISSDPIHTNWGYATQPSSTSLAIASKAWVLIVLVFIIYFAYKNYTQSKSAKRSQAYLIFIGIVGNYLIAFFSEFIFHIVEVNAPAIGYSYSFISFGLVAYAINKYRFFEINTESISGKVLSSISELVIIVNTKKQIIEVNNATLTLLNYAKDELLGRSIDTIIYNSFELCNACCHVKKTNKSIEHDAILLTSKSNRIPITLSCNTIQIDNPKDIGVIFIGYDSTERRKMETLLRVENNKLEDLVSKRTENLTKANSDLQAVITKHQRSERKLSQTILQLETNERNQILFFDNLAHEISTPVNAVIGFSDLLKDYNNLSEEEALKYITIIQNSSLQLQGVVKNVVSMATLNKNKEIIHLEEVNCNYILNSLYLMFKSKAEEKKLEFNCFKKLKDEEAFVITDQIKLTQIISNLLANAFKFTDKGFVHFGYTVSVNKITFFVQDTGIGIPEENHKRIFERYSQGNPTVSELFGGSGLGLSIAKNYVELLGGEIWLESGVAKGSSFNFSLPYTYQVERIH